jgi:mono/diheme cytochrome c family protein
MSRKLGLILGVVAVAAILLLVFVRRVPPAPAPTAVTAIKRPQTRGAQVFEKWCAACHDRGPGHPGTQSLEFKYKGKPPGALEDRKDLTPEMTAYYVRHGIALMPFFRKTEISDADLHELGVYLAKKQ